MTTPTTVTQTLFSIVAVYQVRENYNLDDPKGAPYWKFKGGKEVVCAEGITLDALQLLDVDAKEALVAASTPESDEYYAYDLIDWSIVTLDAELVEVVRGLLADNEVGYARFSCKQGEHAFDWACRQEPAMVEQYRDSWNGWEINQILGVKAA